jgi:hypothetical protein
MNTDDTMAIIEQMKNAGAEGIWLVRGAGHFAFECAFLHDDGDTSVERVRPEREHRLIIVARFPDGDGGIEANESHIEYW